MIGSQPFMKRVLTYGNRDMRLPTVILADDHVVFTDAVVRLLDGRYDVVGTIADGAALIEAVARLRPDVIVMDNSMRLGPRTRSASGHLPSLVGLIGFSSEIAFAHSGDRNSESGANGVIIGPGRQHGRLELFRA
jgi:AmiR/NasT family two-component response regulator